LDQIQYVQTFCLPQLFPNAPKSQPSIDINGQFLQATLFNTSRYIKKPWPSNLAKTSVMLHIKANIVQAKDGFVPKNLRGAVLRQQSSVWRMGRASKKLRKPWLIYIEDECAGAAMYMR
jgi:hypothetical protein